MADKPKRLSGDWDIAKVNRHIGEQRELLKAVEGPEAQFLPTPEFLDDVFVKTYGTGIFMFADKEEVMSKFGLQPDEEFTQHINRVSLQDGQRHIEAGLLTFTRQALPPVKTPTMNAERLQLHYETQGHAHDVATFDVIEHRLGDTVITELSLKEGSQTGQELLDTFSTTQRMLTDCRKGPVSYDMDADVITPTTIIGGPPAPDADQS